MSTAELNPRPVRVSPLIKFSRWSLLTVGIIYGVFHQSRLSRRENARREVELQEKPKRDAKAAAEKKLAVAAEIKMLNDLMGGDKK